MASDMKQMNTIEEAVQDLREGKIIISIDDPDRENEGDFICAAEFATTESRTCSPQPGEACTARTPQHSQSK